MNFYKSLGFYDLFYMLDNNPQKENLYKNGIVVSTSCKKEIINAKEQLCKSEKYGLSIFIIGLYNIKAKKINDEKYEIKVKNTNDLNLLVDRLKILDAYYGEEYCGVKPKTGLKNKNILEQFILLNVLMDNYMNDFNMEVISQWFLIVSNYIYWKKFDFSNYGITEKRKNEILKRLREILNKIHRDFFGET